MLIFKFLKLFYGKNILLQKFFFDMFFQFISKHFSPRFSLIFQFSHFKTFNFRHTCETIAAREKNFKYFFSTVNCVNYSRRYAWVSYRPRLGYIVVCLQDFYKLKNFVLISHCQTECDEQKRRERRACTEWGAKDSHETTPTPHNNHHHPLSSLLYTMLQHIQMWERERSGKKGRKLAIQSLSSRFKRANRVKSNKKR